MVFLSNVTTLLQVKVIILMWRSRCGDIASVIPDIFQRSLDTEIVGSVFFTIKLTIKADRS